MNNLPNYNCTIDNRDNCPNCWGYLEYNGQSKSIKTKIMNSHLGWILKYTKSILIR